MSAHELLQTRDCLEYGCTNDAGPDGVCEEHVMYRTVRGAQIARRAVDLRDQGWSMHEIAAELGVSRAYASALYADPTRSREKARKDGYRQPCPICGTLMDGSSGPNRPPRLCVKCLQQEQSDAMFWTQERLIEAIRAFNEIVGRPPLSSEWLYTAERALLPKPPPQFPTWPWANTVLARFDQWATAIEEAGFERPARGHKVRPVSPDGERRTGMPSITEYVVFKDDGEGLHEVGRAEAGHPIGALEQLVATNNGQGGLYYVASLKMLGPPYKIESRPQFVRVPVPAEQA